MKLSTDLISRCWFIAGPTAVGKTETSLLLAERIGAEICSMDSMAIYSGMDIGTAKPSAAAQSRVPHHLIDLVPPSRNFSLAEYLTCAERVVTEILERNRIPLFIGGTGLYLRSLLRGLFDGPAADAKIRAELDSIAADDPQRLHELVADVDPVSAERLHPNDHRRLVRALEVHRITGVPVSQLQKEAMRPADEIPRTVGWLSPERSWLHDRINLRVDLMMKDGLLDEVQKLLQSGTPLSKTARQALGYREILSHLEEGVPLDEAVELIKTRSRQFAKRQETWFRNLDEVRSIPRAPDDSASVMVDRIIDLFGGQPNPVADSIED